MSSNIKYRKMTCKVHALLLFFFFLRGEDEVGEGRRGVGLAKTLVYMLCLRRPVVGQRWLWFVRVQIAIDMYFFGIICYIALVCS